jgi:hypothetical protein
VGLSQAPGPRGYVENVVATSSDHYAIVIAFSGSSVMQHQPQVQQGFRYEAMWKRADDYKATVEEAWKNCPVGPDPLQSTWASLIQTAGSLQKWSRVSFGSVRRKIQQAEKRLRSLRESPLTDDSLAQEREVEK